MDFDLGEDRRMLRDTLARFLLDRYTPEKRREVISTDDGLSGELWQELADLGIIGALFREDAGGFGGSGFDIATVFEELGRALVVEPFLATLMAGRLLQSAGCSTGLLEEVIGGSRHLALGLGEPASRYDLCHVETTAEASQGAWRLNGRKSVVLNGARADVLIVPARTAGGIREPDGVTLFVVPADTPGLERRVYPTIDDRQAADIVLTNVEVAPSDVLGPEGAGVGFLEDAVAAGIVAVCADAMGAMEAVKELTLDYLRTRKQFGVPIGKFQILQHRMADVLIEMEQSRSALINAAGHLDGAGRLRDKHMSAAKNLFGRAGRQVAEESIQLHGGIAMTDEYIGSHYAKRIIMADHLLGDTDFHLRRFMELSRPAA